MARYEIKIVADAFGITESLEPEINGAVIEMCGALKRKSTFIVEKYSIEQLVEPQKGDGKTS